MDKKKLVKKLKTAKTVKDFGSIVILTCMAVLFTSSIIQSAFSCFTCARGTGSPGPPRGAGGVGVGRKNDGEAANSLAKPKGEAGEGRLYGAGGKEDTLGGRQLLYQLLLFHVHTKTEKYNNQW